MGEAVRWRDWVRAMSDGVGGSPVVQLIGAFDCEDNKAPRGVDCACWTWTITKKKRTLYIYGTYLERIVWEVVVGFSWFVEHFTKLFRGVFFGQEVWSMVDGRGRR